MSSKGTRGAKPTLKAIQGGLSGAPKAPDCIPSDMVGEWDVIAADMVQRKILTASMTGILITYVIALKTVRNCQAAIDEHGVLVSSAHEKLKPNPACSMMTKAMEAVARLSGELGLTPAARSKQGFQPTGGNADEGAPAGLDL